MRKLILLLFLLISFEEVSAQKSIGELYMHFTVIRTNNDKKLGTIKVALDLLKRSSELTNAQIANLNYNLGRLYEETLEEEKAIPYYEASLQLAPDYYVTHRALGNIYIRKSTPIVQKMNEAGKAKQQDVYAKLFDEYKKLIVKAIPLLEKAQACEPDEQDLNQIKNLYKNIKDVTAITTLDARLKKLSAKCVDLLED